MAGQKRMHVYYSGQVQGVGFRYTTRQIGAGFDVTGFVQNLSDGRVLLVAEGELSELERFLEAVDSALGGYVTEKQSHVSAGSGEFSDFGIRV